MCLVLAWSNAEAQEDNAGLVIVRTGAQAADEEPAKQGAEEAESGSPFDAFVVGFGEELSARFGKTLFPVDVDRQLQFEAIEPDPAWENEMLTRLENAANAYFASDYDPLIHSVDKVLTDLEPWRDVIDEALRNPLKFSVNDELARTVKINLGEVAREMTQAGALEQAAETVDLLVSVAPVSELLQSKRLVPPAVQEAIKKRLDTIRGMPEDQRVTLVVRGSGQATGCGISLNADPRAVLPVEDRIDVEPGRVYGLEMTCGNAEDAIKLGPYRLRIAERAQTLPVGYQTLNALVPTKSGNPIALPDERAAQRDVAILIRTLLAVDVVFLMTQTESGQVLALRHDGDSFVRAEASVNTDPRAVWRALRRAEPELGVAVDVDGSGWLQPPTPEDPWLEVGLLSGGGLVAIVGGVLLAVAHADADSTVDSCGSPMSCQPSERTSRLQDATTLATTGQVLLGVGAGVMLLGGVLWIVEASTDDDTSDSPVPRPSMTLRPDSAVGTLTWRW